MLTLSLIGAALLWIGGAVYTYNHLPKWRARATLATSQKENE